MSHLSSAGMDGIIAPFENSIKPGLLERFRVGEVLWRFLAEQRDQLPARTGHGYLTSADDILGAHVPAIHMSVGEGLGRSVEPSSDTPANKPLAGE